MANLVVPKQATIHFNDLTGQWSVKMSEQKQDSNGFQQIIEFVKEVGSLAQIFSQILAFWALLAADDAEAPGEMHGTVGDLSVLTTPPAGLVMRTTVSGLVPAGFSDEGELDDSVVPYDGTGDSWGETPP